MINACREYGATRSVLLTRWVVSLFAGCDALPDPFREVTCGGQDRSGSAFVPGSPGKPSDDSWPSSGNGSCEKEDDRDCVDQCVIKSLLSPDRPWYAIGPQGTDCQEWANDLLKPETMQGKEMNRALKWV